MSAVRAESAGSQLVYTAENHPSLLPCAFRETAQGARSPATKSEAQTH